MQKTLYLIATLAVLGIVPSLSGAADGTPSPYTPDTERRIVIQEAVPLYPDQAAAENKASAPVTEASPYEA